MKKITFALSILVFCFSALGSDTPPKMLPDLAEEDLVMLTLVSTIQEPNPTIPTKNIRLNLLAADPALYNQGLNVPEKGVYGRTFLATARQDVIIKPKDSP